MIGITLLLLLAAFVLAVSELPTSKIAWAVVILIVVILLRLYPGK